MINKKFGFTVNWQNLHLEPGNVIEVTTWETPCSWKNESSQSYLIGYHAFIISQNKDDISAKYPYMSLMAMDLETAKVVAYGEDMYELGLNLINQFKGLDMQFSEVYQSINDFIDALTSL